MKYIFVIVTFFIFFSCSHQKATSPELVRIQMVDQNGTCETISANQRLEKYKHIDFLSSQPLQKVVRIFKDDKGAGKTIVTSYHANGQIKQYLEGIDLRAFGEYKEWYPNGRLKIEATVIGGQADLDLASQQNWLFDGITKAYDEDGKITAEISYEKGALEGTSVYYYSDGSIQKKIPYKGSQIEGYVLEFFKNSVLKEKTFYKNGKAHGTSLVYWENELPLAIEEYMDGKLILGQYFDRSSQTISDIQNGEGTKFVILDDSYYQLIEYKNGLQEGQVQKFNHKNQLINAYSTKNKKKHGRESQFYETSSENILKYTVDWIEDQIHGNVKTWYENGYMESQRQYCKNKKNGPSICWYKDGNLMIVEEYENDVLISGKYYKKGETDPISVVNKGDGVATIYDGDGVFLQKIQYQHSKPQI